MESIHHYPYIIVGAGISGLETALCLASQNLGFIILEAERQIGPHLQSLTLGQITHSLPPIDVSASWLTFRSLNAIIDVAPAWISKGHQSTMGYVKEGSIKIFPQNSDGLTIHISENGELTEIQDIQEMFTAVKSQAPSQIKQDKEQFCDLEQYKGYRMQKGMASLIATMKHKIQHYLDYYKTGLNINDLILVNQRVTSISNTSTMLYVGTQQSTFSASHLFMTVNLSRAPRPKVLLYLIFKQAYWRSSYSGYVVSSSLGKWTQIIDLSPMNLACGVLCFGFPSDRFHEWTDQMQSVYGEMHSLKMKEELLQTVNQMFGMRESSDEVIMFINQESHRHTVIKTQQLSLNAPGITFLNQNEANLEQAINQVRRKVNGFLFEEKSKINAKL